jgi:hypothetical protein
MQQAGAIMQHPKSDHAATVHFTSQQFLLKISVPGRK